MAPAAEAVYFPGLDKCLRGEEPVIPWQIVCTSLRSPQNALHSTTLERFLKDPDTQTLLVDPFTAFQSASSNSQAQFETKTAAINVLPSNNGQYDIEQIKSDARWLSKEANLDGVAALRIVIVEWQQRAGFQLCTQWSAEELVSLQQASVGGGFGALSATKLQSGHSAPSGQGSGRFNTDEERQKRLLLALAVERESFLKACELLIGAAQPSDLQAPAPNNTSEHANGLSKPQTWIYKCGKALFEKQKEAGIQSSGKGFFSKCVDAIKDHLELIANNATWPETVQIDAQLLSAYTKSRLGEVVSVLRIAQLHVQSLAELTSDDQVLSWYELMDQHLFMSEIGLVNPEAGDLVIIVHCLVSIISTSVLQVSQALQYIQSTYSSPERIAYPQVTSKPYLESEECVKLLTSILLGATSQSIRHAGPAVLAWSLIAQNLREAANATRSETPRLDDSNGDTISPISRRTSFRDSVSPKSRPEILLELILDTVPGEDPIAMMGNGAVGDLGVFEAISTLSDVILRTYSDRSEIHTAICSRLTLFQLMREAMPIVTYGPDVVQAVLSVLSYDAIDAESPSSSGWPSQPAQELLDDHEVMGPRLMEQVIARYPYELGPFLACMAAVAKSVASIDEEGSRIMFLLDNMPTITTVMPSQFEGYDLFSEDETNNTIQLTTPLDIFTPSRGRNSGFLTDRFGSSALSRVDSPYMIPNGSLGILLNSSKPLVVSWKHQHSALEYLGILLSTRTASATLVDSTSEGPLDSTTAAEILSLITSLMEVTTASQGADETKQLLGRLSNGLSRSEDVIRVVLEVFEEEMQDHVTRSGTEESIYLLSQCVRFVRATLKVFPERIWAFLGRSQLLALNETTSSFATIVGATEVPFGRFSFLSGCLTLFEGLVEDAIKQAVSRNNTPVRTVTRFQDPVSQSGITPEKLMSSILTVFETTVLDVLQSKSSWRFVDPIEDARVTTTIFSITNTILQYTYGTDDSTTDARKLATVLQPAALAVTSALLSEDSEELRMQPLIDVFATAVSNLSGLTHTNLAHGTTSQTVASLTLCTTILKVGIILEARGKQLMSSLFQAVPLIARLYAAHPTHKGPTADLLTALVQSANLETKEPPSLLGHLAPEASKLFLAVVSRLDMPLNDLDVEVKIWDMLSAIVSNKQQWLAICLLTGSTPRERLQSKDAANGTPKAHPLLSYALDELSKIASLPPRRAVAMLAFISHAQNHWSWATNDIGAHKDFIPAASGWVSELTSTSRPSDTEAALRMAYENQMAAYIADILATYIHSARQNGDVAIIKAIAPKLGFLRDNAVAVDAYNHSLHKNLAKNFAQKFPQCSLSNFKRTALRPADFGRSYFYDIEMASKMLDFESSWAHRKSQGFVDEVARANVNISVVESQVGLLKSWKSLAVELCAFAKDDAQLQRDLAKVVANCLKTNMETSVPSVLFENVQEIRAEFAFIVLQSLVSLRSMETEVRDLVHLAWDAVRTCGQDFDVITTIREADYYRTLLQTLFLSLQPQTYNPASSAASQRKSVSASKSSTDDSPLTPTLLEILQKPIAANFRALCYAVHSTSVESQGASPIVSPTDFVLLTALLQTMLRIPASATAQQQIASIIADTSLIRLSISLYSWSDSLSTADLDPVYGELSILFLLTLSTLPLIAQQMAVEGILSHISAANLSSLFRAANGCGPFTSPTRLHSIWTRGILPLVLNLLSHVGPGIASEVSSFLNAFPTQLSRAITELSTSAAPSLRNPHAGVMTLALAAETHSLTLISSVIERIKAAGPAVGVVGAEIPSLDYDRITVREEIEGALRSRRALRERIVPVGEREMGWSRAKPEKSSSAESLLEERIVAELEGALECLSAI